MDHVPETGWLSLLFKGEDGNTQPGADLADFAGDLNFFGNGVAMFIGCYELKLIFSFANLFQYGKIHLAPFPLQHGLAIYANADRLGVVTDHPLKQDHILVGFLFRGKSFELDIRRVAIGRGRGGRSQ